MHMMMLFLNGIEAIVPQKHFVIQSIVPLAEFTVPMRIRHKILRFTWDVTSQRAIDILKPHLVVFYSTIQLLNDIFYFFVAQPEH